MKQCSKCKEWKDESRFSKYKNAKSGLRSHCKECVKEGHKIWYEDNKEHNLKKKKEWYQDNKEHKLKKSKEKNNSSLSYKSKLRKEIELYEQIRESRNNNIEAICKHCERWFEPTRRQIENRLDAINGNIRGDCNLYCSQKCKESCPVYYQKFYPKDQKPPRDREVQPELSQMVKERDNYTCQRCGWHKDDLLVNIECHHIEGVQWNPIESADEDVCITFCEKCHDEVHDQDGCRYHELRCSN